MCSCKKDPSVFIPIRHVLLSLSISLRRGGGWGGYIHQGSCKIVNNSGEMKTLSAGEYTDADIDLTEVAGA